MNKKITQKIKNIVGRILDDTAGIFPYLLVFYLFFLTMSLFFKRLESFFNWSIFNISVILIGVLLLLTGRIHKGLTRFYRAIARCIVLLIKGLKGVSLWLTSRARIVLTKWWIARTQVVVLFLFFLRYYLHIPLAETLVIGCLVAVIFLGAGSRLIILIALFLMLSLIVLLLQQQEGKLVEYFSLIFYYLLAIALFALAKEGLKKYLRSVRRRS